MPFQCCPFRSDSFFGPVNAFTVFFFTPGLKGQKSAPKVLLRMAQLLARQPMCPSHFWPFLLGCLYVMSTVIEGAIFPYSCEWTGYMQHFLALKRPPGGQTVRRSQKAVTWLNSECPLSIKAEHGMSKFKVFLGVHTTARLLDFDNFPQFFILQWKSMEIPLWHPLYVCNCSRYQKTRYPGEFLTSKDPRLELFRTCIFAA